MQLSIIELYPLGKTRRKVGRRRLSTKDAACNLDVINFTSEMYRHLVNEHANINEIISTTITRLIAESGSTDGFLAVVNDTSSGSDNGGPIQFGYHCIYTAESGVTFKSVLNTADSCMTCPVEPSLLTRAIRKQCIVASNSVADDPRTGTLPANHTRISTFLILPLCIGDKIVGQIGLANAKRYTRKGIERLIPFQQFLSTFTHLWKERKLSVTRELDIKHEVVTLKDSFIATMSHEIRTPLNGIVGMTRLLAEAENLTEKQQKYVHILTECSVQLMELVNDILDYSKMATGNITFTNAPFNLRNCITGTVEVVQPRAADKGLTVKVEIPPDLPENVTGDSRRLKQVLFNLLTNAIKFTEKGGVELTVTFTNATTETRVNCKRVIFAVKDTGIGISSLNQGKIFEVFTKLSADDRFYTNTSPGAGMGLAISKYIVQAMGGGISVESDGTTGSTFTFNVLLDDETDIQALMKIHASELKDKVALVVDDTEDNRIFITDALYSWGITSHVFGSGREALNYLIKHSRIDFAIVDICMPQMSGVELVQSMREHGFKAPVIGLSSIGSDVIGKEWFDKFITKPTSKSTLFNIILQCIVVPISLMSTPRQLSACDFTLQPNSMNILVAEDDYYNQIVIKELLSKLGYSRVTIVNNGKSAVDATRRGARFNVVLMDVKMPVMDGLEATRIIKKQVNPPVIIGVSASVLDIDKNKCFSAGMDGYIPKPIQKEQLESVLTGLDFRRSNTQLTTF